MKFLKNLKLSSKLNAIVIGIIMMLSIVIAFFVIAEVTTTIKQSAVDKARSDLDLTYDLIKYKYPGDWSIHDGQLYKGTTVINGNNEIVDSIGEITNGTVTVFQGDTRIATNVISGVTRAIGTQASDAVIQKTLINGENFYGEAEVAGSTYQTAYMPIRDVNGEIIGMWYVGASQAFIEEAISSVISHLVIVIAISMVVAGVLVYLYSLRIKNRLTTITIALNKAGDGDFTSALSDRSGDEIGQLTNSFNQMKESLVNLISKVAQSSEQVAASSEQLSASAEETSKATENITQSIQEISAGADKQVESTNNISKVILELTSGMGQITERIDSVNNTSIDTENQATVGAEVITSTVKHMHQISLKTSSTAELIEELGQKSTEISNIINMISDVSNQTNLLALNAAIEAARAGEHGRGFAVVADEVRKLAEESNHSAIQINNLIEEIQAVIKKSVVAMAEGRQTVEEGIVYADKAGSSFLLIVDSVKTVSQQIQGVTAEIQNMSAGTEAIIQTINDTSEITMVSAENTQNVAAASEEQNASMEEITASAEALSTMAEELQESIKTFKF